MVVMHLRIGVVLLAMAACGLGWGQGAKLEGVTFATDPDEVFISVREAAAALGWTVGWDDAKNSVLLGDAALKPGDLRRIEDGVAMVSLSRIEALEVKVTAGAEMETWNLERGDKKASVVVPRQEVEVNLNEQELRAWQGKWLVLRTNVSTGRRGFGTPAGKFSALSKARHRVSRKYNNAPMPFAVQIWGGYFIHGSPSVPGWPASHGCVRMPLEGRNPASLLFNWIQVGTKVTVTRKWSETAAAFGAAEA